MRKRCLAQARRAVEKNVVQCIAALPGSADQDLQVLLEVVLADQFGERARPQGVINTIIGLRSPDPPTVWIRTLTRSL